VTTIENTLRMLSMLYEFNKKLRAFTMSARKKQAVQVTEPAAAAGKTISKSTERRAARGAVAPGRARSGCH
jgi:hypothetical protein